VASSENRDRAGESKGEAGEQRIFRRPREGQTQIQGQEKVTEALDVFVWIPKLPAAGNLEDGAMPAPPADLGLGCSPPPPGQRRSGGGSGVT
jgi:hypothetical protein